MLEKTCVLPSRPRKESTRRAAYLSGAPRLHLAQQAAPRLAGGVAQLGPGSRAGRRGGPLCRRRRCCDLRLRLQGIHLPAGGPSCRGRLRLLRCYLHGRQRRRGGRGGRHCSRRGGRHCSRRSSLLCRLLCNGLARFAVSCWGRGDVLLLAHRRLCSLGGSRQLGRRRGRSWRQHRRRLGRGFTALAPLGGGRRSRCPSRAHLCRLLLLQAPLGGAALGPRRRVAGRLLSHGHCRRRLARGPARDSRCGGLGCRLPLCSSRSPGAAPAGRGCCCSRSCCGVGRSLRLLRSSDRLWLDLHRRLGCRGRLRLSRVHLRRGGAPPLAGNRLCLCCSGGLSVGRRRRRQHRSERSPVRELEFLLSQVMADLVSIVVLHSVLPAKEHGAVFKDVYQ